MKSYMIFLCLLLHQSSALPPCPYLDSSGEHHFVPSGSIKTVHVHQPFWETAGWAPVNWNEAQEWCNNTYNNATYSGGRLWEPASEAEYDAVRAEMVAVFPDTGPACRWWIGVLAQGAAAGPRDAFLASSGAAISWHVANYVGGPYVDGSYSGNCVMMNDMADYNGWSANNCGDLAGGQTTRQWICESVKPPKESKCPTKDACKNAFPDSGLSGFCSKKSWLGGDCISHSSSGKPLCPIYENGFPVSVPGISCTCCKECLDTSCSSKGPGWECVNYKASLTYPEGSCTYDGSCRLPDTGELAKGCACCLRQDATPTVGNTNPTPTISQSTGKPTEPPPIECEDKGCLESLEGEGVCISLINADWEHINNVYNLSVPTAPGLCVNPQPGKADCCKCVMKRPCVDRGCEQQWHGQGVCIKTSSPTFSQMIDQLDFIVGGRDDLCGSDSGCCTCFKKKTKKAGKVDCCLHKIVGGVEFQLVEYDKDVAFSLGCTSGCVYEDNEMNRFCFKPGQEEATCQ